MEEERARKERFLLNSGVCLALGAWAYVAFKFLLPATLPFWIGLGIAFVLKPLTVWLMEKQRFRRKSAAFSVLLAFYLCLGLGLWALGLLLIGQLDRGLQLLPQLAEEELRPLLHRCALGFNGLLERLSPPVARLLVQREEELTAGLVEELTTLSAQVLLKGADLARRVPFWFTTAAFSFLCSVFISLDYTRVVQGLLSLLPASLRPLAARFRPGVGSWLGQLLRAYSLLFLVTYGELALGFWLLRVERPFLLALVVALLDVLPFIGVGLVLLPWGLYALLSGQGPLGAGLLLLFGIISIVRNILEPKLLSSSAGLPPLLLLIALYGGLRFFGLWGLLLGPGVLFLAQALRKGPKS